MRPPLESGSGAGVASDPVQEAAAPATVSAAEAQQKGETPVAGLKDQTPNDRESAAGTNELVVSQAKRVQPDGEKQQ